MKANELMIGDWVKLMNPKGEWIDSSQLDANLFGIFLRDGEDGFLQFAPIQLTEEILKANGFFWNDNEKIHVLVNPSKYFIIDKNLETSIGVGHIIKINHVHELQHALRLCGLNDIADNFKLVTT